MKRLISFVILCFPLFAQADLFHGSVSSGMAGTGRAAMDSGEAAFLNPALIPLIKNYELDTYYHDGTLDPSQHRNAIGLGAADNTPEVLFPGAIHYLRTRDTGRAGAPADGELWHAAIGRAVNRNFSFGISGYRLTSKVERDREYVQWNYSLGVLWMINPHMGVAYVLNNLAGASSETPRGLREDMQQAVGFFASLGELARFRFDLTRNERFNPEQRMTYAVGFENLSGDFAVFRAGYRRDDERHQDYVTLGAGFNGPRLKIDYSFEKNVHGTSGALHGVDIRLPF